MQLTTAGYRIVPTLLPGSNVDQLLQLIQSNSYNHGFGIREFLPHNPTVAEWLRTNPDLKQLLRQYLMTPCCIRSIYFDKPPRANWVVGWHQDLTVNLRSFPPGKGWQNVRQLTDRVVAQPPLPVLEAMVTLRIHLDDTTEKNGALRVVPGAHHKGIIRTDTVDMAGANDQSVLCRIPRGGALLMKPLTPHASRRSTAGTAARRVIHLEFLDQSKTVGMDLQEIIPF